MIYTSLIIFYDVGYFIDFPVKAGNATLYKSNFSKQFGHLRYNPCIIQLLALENKFYHCLYRSCFQSVIFSQKLWIVILKKKISLVDMELLSKSKDVCTTNNTLHVKNELNVFKLEYPVF